MNSIEVSESQGVRYLHFGSHLVQGAMRIARPDSLELEYTREMMLPLVLRGASSWPRSVLQIGLGSASLTRFLLRHRPKAQLTVVEITPQVIAAARQFFKLPEESPRLRIEVGDGHDYVAGTHRRFDLVLVDGFDAAGRAGMLETVPFYVNCRSRLHSGGMMAANLLTRNRGVEPIVARIREAFADRLLVLPPCDKGNTIVLASNGRDIDVASEAWREAARKLKAETALDLSPTLRRLFR